MDFWKPIKFHLITREKIENMEELMKSLKDKQLVSGQQHNLFHHNLGGVSKCLFETKWQFLSSKTSIHIATIWRQNSLQ